MGWVFCGHGVGAVGDDEEKGGLDGGGDGRRGGCVTQTIVLQKRASGAFPPPTAQPLGSHKKEKKKTKEPGTTLQRSHSYMHGLIGTEHNVVCSLTHKHGGPPRIHILPVSQRKVMRPQPPFDVASVQ